MAKDTLFDARWNGASVDCLHWHFHAKLLERYEIVLAPGEFSDLIKALIDGRAPIIEMRSGGKAIHSYKVRSARERIYVLAKGGHPITAWPPTKKLNRIRRAMGLISN